MERERDLGISVPAERPNDDDDIVSKFLSDKITYAQFYGVK